MDLPETQARRWGTGPSGVQRGLEDRGISVSRGGSGTGHPEAKGDAVAHAVDQVSVDHLGTEGLGYPDTEEIVSGDGEVDTIVVIGIGHAAEQRINVVGRRIRDGGAGAFLEEAGAPIDKDGTRRSGNTGHRGVVFR